MKFENIRNLREDNDKTQKEVAAYLNIKQTHILNMNLEKSTFLLMSSSNLLIIIQSQLIISLVVEKSKITKNKECALHILAPAALLSASGACLARTEVET